MAANHDDTKNAVTVLVVPYLAQSHLNMFFHLSQLITSYGMPVHYASSTQHIKQLKLRNTETDDHNGITFHGFPLPSTDNLVDVYRTVTHLHKPISDLLRELSSRNNKMVVIHDTLMSSVVKDVTAIPNAEAYNFNTVSAFSIFVNIWTRIPVKPFELDTPDALPSFLPAPAETRLPSDFADFITEQWRLNFTIHAGTLYNGNRAVEGTYIGYLEKLQPMKKHFAVGPVISKKTVLNCLSTDQNASSELSKQVQPRDSANDRCLKWLDCQEKESVIYISFGTSFSFPEKQLQELATGIERSGLKFIWVLRKGDKGDIFSSAGDNQEEDEVKKVLPEGFVERVGNKGMVVSEEWVLQLEILGHPSVGGFMTHCGWGSLTESMTMGVPVIAYPIHSDQPLNSVLVTQVLKNGLLIRDDFWDSNRDQIITSDILEDAMRRLMTSDEGQAMRTRAKDIGHALQGSMAQGGASHLDLDTFIAHITRP